MVQDRPSNLVDALAREARALPQAELVLEHSFTGSAYIRAGWVPAGTLVVGKRLAEKVPLILLTGRARVHSDGNTVEVVGPWATVSEAGTRRAFYAITDCYFMNTVLTDESDINLIEQATTIPEEPCSLPQSSLGPDLR